MLSLDVLHKLLVRFRLVKTAYPASHLQLTGLHLFGIVSDHEVILHLSSGTCKEIMEVSYEYTNTHTFVCVEQAVLSNKKTTELSPENI